MPEYEVTTDNKRNTDTQYVEADTVINTDGDLKFLRTGDSVNQPYALFARGFWVQAIRTNKTQNNT